MVVALEGIPVVGCRNKPTPADPHDFAGELLLPAWSQDMFAHGIREDEIEALVREGKSTAVEDGVNTFGIIPPRAGEFGPLVPGGNHAFRIGIDIFERVA